MGLHLEGRKGVREGNIVRRTVVKKRRSRVNGVVWVKIRKGTGVQIPSFLGMLVSAVRRPLPIIFSTVALGIH